MTDEQKDRLEQLITVVRESAEKIIDNNHVSDRELYMMLFQQGFKFLRKQDDQSIVDVGSVGLAFAVRRATAG